MSRPRKDTNAVLTKLCKAIQLGATYELACKFARIAPSTLRNWLQAAEQAQPGTKARQVLERLEAAEGLAAVGWLAKIEAAANDGTWQAAAWKLERRYPDSYGRQVVQHEGSVNLVAQPEWQAMRTQILAVLSAFPEARLAIAEVLSDGTRNGTGT
jgi:hypothetical protein